MMVARLDERGLADFVKSASVSGLRLVMAFHDPGYRFVLLKLRDGAIVEAASGELTRSLTTHLVKLANRGQLYGATSATKADLPGGTDELTPFVANLTSSTATHSGAAIKAFSKSWADLVGLTRQKFTRKVENAVFARAGGCCEFKGCGAPLFEAAGHLGYFGYMAHIVGAIFGGPRGDDPLPAALRNEADNVLLLCDIHHRLIDRIAPDRYDSTTLRAMRDASLKDRRAYSIFRGLPEADVVAVLSDIQGVTTDISTKEAFKALERRGYRPHESQISHRYFADSSGGRDAGVPTYWPQFLETNRTGILTLVHTMRGQSVLGPTGRPLAIFPVGNMPMLVLAGRIIGEGRPVELFHRNRTLRTWADPDEPGLPNPIRLVPELVAEEAADVAITLELTASIDLTRLPPAVADVPRLRIICERQGQDPFTHSKDMPGLLETVREALHLAEDKMKAKRIHLIMVAPADCAFALGMKIQARKHAKMSVYQAPKEGEYFPALILGRQVVTSADGTVTVDLM